MESLEKDLYSAAFRKWEISPSSKAHGYGPDGALRTFENDFGEGEYWSYFRGNLFAINSFNMTFTKNWVLRYRCTEHLCIGFYDEIEGVAQRRGAPLSVGAISVYLGEEDEEYEARVLEGASAKGTSITFSPDYYRTYLQGRFGSIRDIRRAFLEADGRRDMPNLVDLLRKARSYQGTGIAAELFYEGVISEAVAIVMQHSSLVPPERLRECAWLGVSHRFADLGYRGVGLDEQSGCFLHALSYDVAGWRHPRCRLEEGFQFRLPYVKLFRKMGAGKVFS